MITFALIKCEEGYFVLTDDKGDITGFKDIKDGVEAFTSVFRRSLTKGQAPFMMHLLQFDVSIVQLPDIPAIQENVLGYGPYSYNYYSGESARYHGIPAKAKNVAAIHKKGVKPSLKN